MYIYSFIKLSSRRNKCKNSLLLTRMKNGKPPNDESFYHHQRSKDSSDDLWFSFQPIQIHIFYELGIGRIFRDPNSLPGQKQHESGSLIGWSVSSKFLFSLKEPLKTDSRCGYSHGGLILLIRLKIRDFTFFEPRIMKRFFGSVLNWVPDLTYRAWWSLIFWRRAWKYTWICNTEWKHRQKSERCKIHFWRVWEN